MKRIVITILFCLQSQIFATTYFRDGLTHDIDYNVGGSVNYNIKVENNLWEEPTTINLLAGGYVNGNLQAYDNSIINLSGGDVRSDLSLNDYAILTFSAGSIGWMISTERNTNMFMTGGYVRYILHYGTLNMFDGQIAHDLIAADFSTTVLSGGVISRWLLVSTEADVTIIGKDFLFDGRSVSGVIVNPLSESNSAHLTGKYLNGDPIDFNIIMHPSASITISPEPMTLLLFGIGAVIIKIKRSKGK